MRGALIDAETRERSMKLLGAGLVFKVTGKPR